MTEASPPLPLPSKDYILQVVKTAQEKIGCRNVYLKNNDHNTNNNNNNNDDEMTTNHPPRFILFHSPFSTCSEKVRAVMGATNFSWIGHTVNLQKHDPYETNYSPEYVHLRKVAWEQLGKPPPPLLGEEGTIGWNGNNSTFQHGLDLTAVPTLVDLHPTTTLNGDDNDALPKVIVDSGAICYYLAKAAAASAITTTTGTGNLLIPEEATSVCEMIDKHMKLVDDLPQAALILGGNPADDRRPYYLQLASKKKVLLNSRLTALEKALADKETGIWDDPILERAYKAKLEKSKEDDANGQDLKGNESRMTTLLDKVYKVLDEVEADLKKSSTGWICGTKQPTMVDFVFGASLYRLIWLGMGDHLFSKYPMLQTFSDKVYDLKSMQDVILFFPGSPPSYSTTYLHKKYQGVVSAFLHDRKTDMFICLATLKLTLTS